MSKGKKECQDNEAKQIITRVVKGINWKILVKIANLNKILQNVQKTFVSEPISCRTISVRRNGTLANTFCLNFRNIFKKSFEWFFIRISVKMWKQLSHEKWYFTSSFRQNYWPEVNVCLPLKNESQECLIISKMSKKCP